MSCDNCLCRTCIFSCELSYSRDPDELDAIDDICFTCDECRWWHGADPRYRIQTRCECERYREFEDDEHERDPLELLAAPKLFDYMKYANGTVDIDFSL